MFATRTSVSISTACILCKRLSRRYTVDSPTTTCYMSTKAIQALRKASKQKHLQRLAKEELLQKEGAKEVGQISKRDLFIAGLALYWGEGYKSLGQEVGFTNSDPAMLLFFIKWLSRCYGVTSDRLICRISINAIHAARVTTVEKYWRQFVGLPQSQFTKTSLIKAASKKVYKNHLTHYGTLRIKVRNGTDLRRKILGSIGHCKRFGMM